MRSYTYPLTHPETPASALIFGLSARVFGLPDGNLSTGSEVIHRLSALFQRQSAEFLRQSGKASAQFQHPLRAFRRATASI